MPVHRHDVLEPERRRARRSFRVTVVFVAALHAVLVGLLIYFASRSPEKKPLGDITWLDAGAFTTALAAPPEPADTPEPTPEATPEPTPPQTPEPTPPPTPEPTPESTPEPTPPPTPEPTPDEPKDPIAEATPTPTPKPTLESPIEPSAPCML